ncbi:MAG: RagB/SusD family nutrient uptake outer membrane protein, partial [Muribaculaceae bacterium]|nr:RagB/SusD family nutrient uptake outer membrane protein [Muribaculaceae bacterium]
RWNEAADAARNFIATGMWEVYVRHADDADVSTPGWGFYAQFEGDDYSKMDSWQGHKYTYAALSGCILSSIHASGNEKEHIYDPPTCNGGSIPSGGYPTHEMAECFPMKDGAKPGEGKYTYDRMKPGENRDPRFGYTITYNGALRGNVVGNDYYVYTYKGIGATTDAFGQATRTGYYWRKALHRGTIGNSFISVTQSFQVMRYEEILLNYAEATNEYYGPNYTEVIGETELGPMQVLRILRERAGIEAGADGNYGLQAGMDQAAMREAIRLERRIELAAEGHRFFDVRRWLIADETENAMAHGFEITAKIDGTFSGRVVNVRQHVFRKAMYFWPIPYNEVMRSADLKQNPYYD